MIERKENNIQRWGSGLFSNFTTSQYFISSNIQQQQKRFINLLKLLSVAARLFIHGANA